MVRHARIRDVPGCRRLETSQLGSNVYVVQSPGGALVIDSGHPRTEAATLAAVREQVGPDGIRALLVTHAHADHVGATGSLQAATGAEVWSHAPSRDPVLAEQERRLQLVPRPYQITRHLTDGERIDLGDDTLRVVHTPGHARDHLAFFLEQRRVLFCGDLFGFEDIGTFDISRPHRQALEVMLDSVQRCAELNPARVCPGHGPVVDDTTRLFRTVEKRMHTFRQYPSILVSHTLMPLLLLLIESRSGKASLAEIRDYALSHADAFGEFLDGLDGSVLVQELGKVLVILEMKGLIALDGERVRLSSPAYRAAA